VGTEKADNVAAEGRGLDYASPAGLSGGDRGADVVRWLFPAYIFMILVGFFALRAPGVMPTGNDLNPDRAVFTSVNAATLTGFQMTMHPTAFSPGGKATMLCLTVLGTLFTLVVGGMAVKRILRLAWPDSRLVTAAVLAEIFVLLIGAFAAPPGKMIGGMTQAAAAWANSGLYVDAAPQVNEAYTHVVLLPLSVLGGMGLVVLLQLLDGFTHRAPLSRHTRVVINMTAALFLIGFAAGVLLQLIDLEKLGYQPKTEAYWTALGRSWSRVLERASVMAVNVRTAGLNIFPVYVLPNALTFFLTLLMMVGASPGGTGGGLKTTTVWELINAPRRLLRGEAAGRTLGIAASWFGTYLIALAFFQTMLTWAEPQMPGDRVWFLVVSALSNVGLSHDVLSMTHSSILLVSAAMFFGRITPLLILWWMADTTRDADIAVA
jgi:trk system potassium uptake protein TrkH